MTDILIEGGVVLTMNPEWKIYPDGAVAVKGDQIVDVGPTDELKKKHQSPKRAINAKDKLVMPGLVNCHCHFRGHLTKGMVPGNYGWGSPFLERLIQLNQEENTEYRTYLAAMMCCLESIRGGITTLIDAGTTAGNEGIHARVITESGIRGIIAVAAEDIFGGPGYKRSEAYVRKYGKPSAPTAEDNIKRIEDLIQQYHNTAGGRLGIWAMFRQLQNASDKLYRMLKELADSYGVGLTAHANVVRPMIEAFIKAWGKTPIMRLYDNGVLGPNVLLAHAAHMPGRDMMAVKETGTSLAHCIFTSMGLGYGATKFADFPAMREMGINIALGTDGARDCNHKDMVRVMCITYLAHKEGKFDCNLWPPKTVVEMATRDGARALGMSDKIGSLEPGKKADMILFDLTRPEWVPYNRYNLIENLVLSATGDSVDTSIINGKIVMEGREIKTFDAGKIVEEAQKEAGPLIEGFPFLGTEKPYPDNMPPLW